MRESIERASLPLLTAISRLPRAVPFLLVLGLMVAGALVPGWGWVLLVVVAVFLVWLLYLAWPKLRPSERLMRVAVVVLAVGLAVVRAFPQR